MKKNIITLSLLLLSSTALAQHPLPEISYR